MRDVELYRHLLGLEAPWTVRSVELNVLGQRADVWAASSTCSPCRSWSRQIRALGPAVRPHCRL